MPGPVLGAEDTQILAFGVLNSSYPCSKTLLLLGAFPEHRSWVGGPPAASHSSLATLGSCWKEEPVQGTWSPQAPALCLAQGSQEGRVA